MLKTLGVVEVAGQCAGEADRMALESFLERRFGGRSLIEWVARRVTEAQQLDAVVIVAGKSAPCDAIRRLAPIDTPLYASDKPDSLGRMADVLKRYPAKWMVRVRVRSAFIDPALIDRLTAAAAGAPPCDYVGFRSSDGRPAFQSALGMFAEWFCAGAIARADREAKPSRGERCPARYMLAHPERYSLRLTAIPAPLDRRDLRLSLEVEDDWRHAHDIVEALGADELDWQSIAGLLDRQPEMRRRMAELNRVAAPHQI